MNETSPKRSRSNIVLWVVLAIPGIILLVLVPLFLYITHSSRNAQFVISPQGLQIRGSLYGRTIPREQLDVQEAMIVNLDAEPNCAPVARTNGTSVPGYSEGWFRLSDGRKALLVVSDNKQVVYVPTTQGYVVMLSPIRPEFFLSALKRGTAVPVSSQIVPAAPKAGICLLSAALLPILIIAPIVFVALRQRRPARPFMGPGVLYADHLVEITGETILFHSYYFPIGSKRVWLDQVEYIQARPATLWTGAWRIWGSGDLRTWFPADWNRPNRDVIFLLVRKGKWTRIGFTVEDSAAVKKILRSKGLLREA